MDNYFQQVGLLQVAALQRRKEHVNQLKLGRPELVSHWDVNCFPLLGLDPLHEPSQDRQDKAHVALLDLHGVRDFVRHVVAAFLEVAHDLRVKLRVDQL